MLPTPRGCDSEGGPLMDAKWNESGFYRENKQGVRWGVKTKDAIASIGTSRGLKLQPAFVEWMMGYPLGYTHVGSPDSKPSGTRSSRKSPTRSSKESQKSKMEVEES
jgi:hypothetical protein